MSMMNNGRRRLANRWKGNEATARNKVDSDNDVDGKDNSKHSRRSINDLITDCITEFKASSIAVDIDPPYCKCSLLRDPPKDPPPPGSSVNVPESKRSKLLILIVGVIFIYFHIVFISHGNVLSFLLLSTSTTPTLVKSVPSTSISIYTTSSNSADPNVDFPLDCQFSTGDQAPQPIIYMSLGRSGSSVTWDTMARLLGDTNPPKAKEITGSIAQQADIFFDQIIPENVGEDWVTSYLCHEQQTYPDAKIVGFQWKPYINLFDHKYGIQTLKKLKDMNNPDIKVIYSSRNQIDVRLSNMRHDAQRDSKNELEAHCLKDDEECQRRHIRAANQLFEFPLDNLEEWLKNSMRKRRKILEWLDETGVSYFHLQYEDFYESKNYEEKWMDLFKFLGRGPQEGLTKNMIEKNFSMAKTSRKKHYDLISNYDQLYTHLEKINFSYLLDKRPEKPKKEGNTIKKLVPNS